MSETHILPHRPETPIVTYIPFTGKEKKCWDCGGDRQLMVKLDRNGDLEYFDECCEGGSRKPIDVYECPCCGLYFRTAEEYNNHMERIWPTLNPARKKQAHKKLQELVAESNQNR